MNKKGADTGFGLNKIITLILIVFVIALVMISIFYWKLPEKIKNLFPDLQKEKISNETINEQVNLISDKEKKIGPEYNNYPFVELIYFGDNSIFNFNDIFWVRWNFNLSKPQIIMDINFRANLRGHSKEWLIDPNLEKAFNTNDLYDSEKNEIKLLMHSTSYLNFLNNVLKFRKNYRIDIQEEIESNTLSESWGFPTEPSNIEELNKLLRENQGEYFKNYDQEKSLTAKEQIQNLAKEINSLSTGNSKELIIKNLEGWYVVGKLSNKICLCPEENCESELSVCNQSKTVGTNQFLDKSNYGITLKGS